MKKPSEDSAPPTCKPKITIKFRMKNQELSNDHDHDHDHHHHHHHHRHHSPISDLKPKKLIVKKSQPKIIIKFGNNIKPAASTHHSPPSIKPKITFKLGKQQPSNDLDGGRNSFENSHGSSWRRGPLLGMGGFGSVFLARYCTKSTHYTDIAVKSSLIKDSSSLRFEKKVLDDLWRCSNVVHCYGEEVTKSSGKPGKEIYNILMEYCSGGSLQDLIVRSDKGLMEGSVRFFTRDIVLGIAYIHEKGYIHCDIKPGNILLSVNNNYNDDCRYLVAKIADFGLALKNSITNMDDEFEIRGTELYKAPESFIDWPVDIWALGCVVLEMLTARTLWTSRRFDPQHFLTQSYDKLPKKFRRLSPLAIDFLSKCFIQSPYQRSSARSLLDHPFIHF